MSINKYTYLGLAIDTKGVDIAVGLNEDEDLFYRPHCERTDKISKYWHPNRRSSKIDPSECGNEIPLIKMANDEHQTLTHISDAFKKRLTPEERQFLEDLMLDYDLVVTYFEYWS